jgi:YggT family protein
LAFIAELLNVYLFAILARIVLSWFPITPGTAMASIFSFLYSITEPVLGPVRRIIPSMGPIDISPIVVIIAIELLAGALARG